MGYHRLSRADGGVKVIGTDIDLSTLPDTETPIQLQAGDVLVIRDIYSTDTENNFVAIVTKNCFGDYVLLSLNYYNTLHVIPARPLDQDIRCVTQSVLKDWLRPFDIQLVEYIPCTKVHISVSVRRE
jgi:hypothetical protein